jgi:hypothetical protein
VPATELRPSPFRIPVSSQDVARIDGKTRSSVVRTSIVTPSLILGERASEHCRHR